MADDRPLADDRPVPDWLLERLARGELPAAEATRLRARLEARGEMARLQAIELSDGEILKDHPPAAVAAEVHRRARLPARAPATLTWRSGVFSGLALGAAGLAVLFAMNRPGRPGDGPVAGLAPAEAPEVLIEKGNKPHLALYRKVGKRFVQLADGTRTRRGDLLQLSYVAAGRRYGVIASVDAADNVSLHLPASAGPAVRLESGQETVEAGRKINEIALPTAFELDATPGFERFVFVTADAPFDTGAVVAALKRQGPPLPSQFSLHALTLYKEKP
jgi:hypothetical protein